MLAQVLNPASWQATGLLVAAAASPFASSYAQQQQTSMTKLQQAQQQYDQPAVGGAAQLPLSDKLRCLSAALTARFPRGTLAFSQVRNRNCCCTTCCKGAARVGKGCLVKALRMGAYFAPSFVKGVYCTPVVEVESSMPD